MDNWTITSFIIHYLGWEASNMFWGHLSEMLLYRASEATTFVNTCRLIRIYVTRLSLTVSDLQIMLKGLWDDSNRNTGCVASTLRILTTRGRTAGVEPQIRSYSAGS